MRATRVKIAIVFIITCFATLAVWFVVVHYDVDHYAELDRLAHHYETQPSEASLRDLLNYPSDGAYSYYHMALVGEAFSADPKMFQRVSSDLKTDRERSHIHQIASFGDGVFEYYPEREPSEFDQQIDLNQSWLDAYKK